MSSFHLFFTFVIISENKCTFNLSAYMSGEISPRDIVLENVISKKVFDLPIHPSESPLRLDGFGSDVFSLEHLVGASPFSLVNVILHDSLVVGIGATPITFYCPV